MVGGAADRRGHLGRGSPLIMTKIQGYGKATVDMKERVLILETGSLRRISFDHDLLEFRTVEGLVT